MARTRHGPAHRCPRTRCGAWAAGSSWRRVIRFLHQRGIPVVAAQNPTISLADDVTATRQALSALVRPELLVGHSWGGTVITEAGNDPKAQPWSTLQHSPPALANPPANGWRCTPLRQD